MLFRLRIPIRGFILPQLEAFQNTAAGIIFDVLEWAETLVREGTRPQDMRMRPPIFATMDQDYVIDTE